MIGTTEHYPAALQDSSGHSGVSWAAIFAVSTALAGIWGMNFEHMPELKWALGYPMALGVIFSAGAVLYWRFRKAGWL